MEETHHKVILDLQRQHQREISKLMEERERLLAEETAATIAGKEIKCITIHNCYSLNKTEINCVRSIFHLAIEAMKNAHKEELEKTQRSQLSGLNSDIDELRLEYEYVFCFFCFLTSTGKPLGSTNEKHAISWKRANMLIWLFPWFKK